MKICLVCIRPRDTCYPLSVVYLKAYVNHELPKVEVRIVDAGFEDPFTSVVDSGCQMVGISATSADYELATKLAEKLKTSLGSNFPILIGGVHITSLPDSLRPCFTVGVRGEGEKPLCDLLRLYIRQGQLDAANLSHIKGLVYREGSVLKKNPIEALPLDNYPHLDYDSINPWYFEPQMEASFARVGVVGTVMSSRGCPFHCPFCATSHFWGKYRTFSISWVVEEIRRLIDRGVTLINLTDDLLTVSKPRLRELANAVRSHGWHRKCLFCCASQAQLFDEETCEILKSFNVSPIYFGFESGNPKMLEFLKCGKTSVEDNYRAVLLCEQYGFQCMGSVIIGSPGETILQMQDTLTFMKWCLKHHVTRVGLAVLIPYPGTPMWEIAEKMGVVDLGMDFSRLDIASTDSRDGFLVSPELKPEFLKLRHRGDRIAHRFKLVKARLLFRHSPIGAVGFAFQNFTRLLKSLVNPAIDFKQTAPSEAQVLNPDPKR